MSEISLSIDKARLLKEFLEFCSGEGQDEDIDVDFYDLSVGWFLAKGASVQTAFELAVIARYEAQYGKREVVFKETGT